MVLNVKNKEEARLIQRALESKGWVFKYSVWWSQVWVKDGQTVYLHKSPEYREQKFKVVPA